MTLQGIIINEETITVNTDQLETILVTNTNFIKGDKGDSFSSTEYSFTNSNLVTINHNKNYYPSVTVLNLFNQQVLAEIEHISVNQIKIYFSSNQSGKVIIN